MGLFNFSKKGASSGDEVSDQKKELIKEGKKYGLNLDSSMSVFDMQKSIEEAKKKEEPKPKEQKSNKTGEY